jgi:hypothetical protein
MAEQNANNVNITGGTISGVTIPASNVTGTLGVPNGGTGASTLTGYVYGNGTSSFTASATIPYTDILGLGTISTQDSNGVRIGGGYIDNTDIGSDTAATGAFTELYALGIFQAQGQLQSFVPTGTAPFAVSSTTPVANLNIGGNAATATTATTANNATKTSITNNTTSSATWYPTIVSAISGNLAQTVSSANFSFVPSTGVLSAIAYTGTWNGDTIAVNRGGTGVTASSGANSVVLRDASQNITANAYFNGFTSVAASASLITLTVASSPVYLISGSGGQTIKLPDATTLPLGTIFSFNNNQSSGAITVNNNSNTLVVSVPSGGYTAVILLTNSTASGTWDRHDETPSNVSWSTNTFDYPGSITSATWNGNTVQVNKGGTGATTLTGYVKGSGTTALTASSTIPTTDLSGTITNAQLQNSAITINGTSTSLGGSINVGTVTSVAALTIGTTGTDLSSTVATGTTTPVITLQVPTASATNRGALSSADWTTFNSKAPALTYTTNYVPYGQGTTTPALSASFTYDPTLKNLSAPQVRASNGIVVNSKTVSASYSIASGDCGMSVGPVTISTGQTVTVASGSRWVVL